MGERAGWARGAWDLGGLHSLCQGTVSGAEGRLVGLVRAEPGSAREVMYALGRQGTGRGWEVGGEVPIVVEEKEEDEKEGTLWGLQALVRAAA